MATLGSKLQTKEMSWLSNMTEQSHLGRALMIKPHKVEGIMNTLFSSHNYYSENPMTSLMLGKEEEITSTEIEWELKSATVRPLVIVADVEPANATKGKYRRNFRMKLDEDWYLPGDVIFPGTSDKKYQVRVQSNRIPDGDGFIYEVRINTDNPDLFIPQSFFKPGQQWAKLYSQYEEGAEQSGSTVFSTTIAFKNKMSKFRKEYRVTDYASQEVLCVKIPDANGKLVDSWVRYAEVEYWQQWYKEVEKGYWYGRSTETVPGSTGRPVRQGAGLQEQLEDSHVYRYSMLSTTLIEEYLMDIFYGRVKPGKGRHIKAFTGEYGMLQFHRAVMDWAEKGSFVKNIEPFIKKENSDLNEFAFSTGMQFVKYHMANGSSLELVHNPLYDDREINFEIDPITGYPIESQRFTFLDFTGQESKSSNIKIYKKKGAYSFTYVEGMFGPYGGKKGGTSAHAGDYYEMHVNQTCMINVEDVTKCGELILSRN